MQKKDLKVVEIETALIVADEKQPRRNFDASRMKDLIKSIKTHGILSPLIVESQKSGHYLLVDGERRFRAAKEIPLTKVPAIVMPPQNEVDRLVQQFHLQEQHEGWTSVEKAVAVSRLAEDLNTTIEALAEMLSLPRRTIADYVSFSKLLEKKEFQKNEIAIAYAPKIINLKHFIRRQWVKHLEEEFTQEDERKLELALINRIKNGLVETKNDILKIQDSVRSDPSSIKRFIKDGKMSADKLFLTTNAKAAQLYRRIYTGLNLVASYVAQTEGLNLKKVAEADTSRDATLNVLKRGYVSVGKFIKEIE